MPRTIFNKIRRCLKHSVTDTITCGAILVVAAEMADICTELFFSGIINVHYFISLFKIKSETTRLSVFYWCVCGCRGVASTFQSYSHQSTHPHSSVPPTITFRNYFCRILRILDNYLCTEIIPSRILDMTL
jgi:hypothetical protein